MVKYLNWLFMRVKSIISLGFIAISFIAIMVAPSSVFAASGELIDPTMSSMDVALVGANAGGLNTEVMAEPVLQLVLLSSSRKRAVISGKIYKVGDKVSEATLIKVSDHEAVLRNSDSTLQTLHMHHGVMKEMKEMKEMIDPPPPRGSVQHKIKRAVTRTGQIK